MNQAHVAGAIGCLRTNVSSSNVRDIYGEAVLQEALRQLEREKLKGLSFGGLLAKQKRELRQHFRDRSAAGIKTHKVSQSEHDLIISYIYTCISEGEQPLISVWLKQYAQTNNKPTEWIRNALKCTNSRRMRQSLNISLTDTVRSLLISHGFWTPSHKSALFKSTYVGLATLLFSWWKLTSGLSEIEIRLSEAMRTKAALQYQLNSATAHFRDWKSEAKALHSQGKSYGDISKQVGKSKTTVHDYLCGSRSAIASPVLSYS